MATVQHQKSHYLLPLNSMIFKSNSSSNLLATSQRNIYTKSTTTIAHIPVEERVYEEDEFMTALPPPPSKHIRRQPKAQDLTASSLRSASSDEQPDPLSNRALRRSRSMGDLDAGNKKKGSAWRRFIDVIKKPFRKEKDQEKPKGLVISGPTDFQHLGTGTGCLPERRAPATEEGNGEGDAEDWETVGASESFNR